jgi:hypothetical protein
LSSVVTSFSSAVLPAHWLRVRKQLAQELGLENLIITSHVDRKTVAGIIKLFGPRWWIIGQDRVRFDSHVFERARGGVLNHPFHNAERLQPCRGKGSRSRAKSYWGHENFFEQIPAL